MKTLLISWLWIILGYFICSFLLGFWVKTYLFFSDAKDRKPFWLFTTHLILLVVMASIMGSALRVSEVHPSEYMGYMILGFLFILSVWKIDKDFQDTIVHHYSGKLGHYLRRRFSN